MYAYPLLDVAGPGLVIGLLALGTGMLVVLYFLIVLAETVVLQLMHWGIFRRSLTGSLLMNIPSTIVGIPLMGLVTSLGYFGLLIAWAVSVVIEGAVLVLMNREAGRLNWRVAIVANLVSYVIFILPAYLLSQS